MIELDTFESKGTENLFLQRNKPKSETKTNK